MPELAHGEWEHLFEPWFADQARNTPGTKLQPTRPDAIFSEASQPLAVRRQDFIERQSPVSRAVQFRGVNVTTEMERLVAYAERRHHGVEVTESERAERPPLRDAPLRRLEAPATALPFATGNTLSIIDRSADAPSSPHLPAGGSFRTLLTFVLFALVAAYAFYVQQSAAAALSRATAAERMVEVMTSPDARRIELSGSAAAQGAVGHALYSRSRGAIVSATDLPSPEQGHTYQVWATTATGSVSLGLAAIDARGRMAAAYELPPGLADSIRGFVVTQERVGGSSRPTGQMVLSN